MFEPELICPYTGLRSFTEEESLYFKGRDVDIDQATEQLQRNKFLMLTGASGDGKSSLIYAGIIPNARAGFLKSKFTNWCVADFRPERSPFENLCKAIARQLDIPNYYTVKSELDHGFSAIADLYKNSKRFIDTDSVVWKEADDKGKAVLKREAANLLILVDQFEEFFTNPENYHKGVPSTDSNLVLNLLLETVRIALEEDLPIYVVFTMRSDYIGQCAAFRGLPEYIGFSQFFVPRLNRTQLQQVIEEPALLSGNRITRRLTERLIHDLTEGVDQLPILQHALNQIWHAAENGSDEMDLLHYAMVGGMPENELPDEQVDRFRTWFQKLPAEIKACYHKPDLQNVLDTHTNKLYEQAEDYYFSKTTKRIADADAKEVIKNAFTCLTKIDQSRAVRNRMTLREITDILNRPGFGTKEVGLVLDIFREPGNTFIRPFKTEDNASDVLHEDDVLDITHESLIRNWEYLGQWAKEEHNNHNVYLDFEQQLNRWVESGKSGGFLLSIGPLTYFENWFKKAKPNAYWIARYLPEEIEEDKKLGKAREQLAAAEEFIAKSARKHTVTRTIMRYGAKRIAAVLGIIAIIALSSFAVRDYIRKRNDQVLKTIKQETIELANRPRLSPEYPAPLITEQLLLGNLTIPGVINEIKDHSQKIKIATAIATHLVMQGRNEPRNEIHQSLFIADSLLSLVKLDKDPLQLSEKLKLQYDFTITAGYARLYSLDPALDNLVKKNARRNADWSLYVLKNQPARFNDIQVLSIALEDALGRGAFEQNEINDLVKILSPFENENRSEWVKNNFARNKVLIRGTNNYGTNYNNLFQDLAYLYAASGNTVNALQCIDTILNNQQAYLQNDYTNHVENATNIVGVFYENGYPEQVEEFVNGYCAKKKLAVPEFYWRLVSRHLVDEGSSSSINFYAGGGGQVFANMNIKFCSDSALTFFFRKLDTAINSIGDINERNFQRALMLKNELVAKGYRKEIREDSSISNNAQYDEAIRLFFSIPASYLDEQMNIASSTAADMVTVPRKFLFLFPDYRVPFHPFEPRSTSFYYTSASFIDHILEKNLFDTLYRTNDELKYFESWMKDYHGYSCSRDFYMHDPIPYPIFSKLAEKLEARNASQVADLNIFYMHLAEMDIWNNNQDKAVAHLKRIVPEKLLNAFQYKLLGFINNYSLKMVGHSIAVLAANGEFAAAYRIMSAFKNEVNRSSLYAYASQVVTTNYNKPEIAQQLIDSSKAEMVRLDDPAAFQPNKTVLAIALAYADPEKNISEANAIIKNSFDKLSAISKYGRALGYHGNLYKAGRQNPALVSSFEKSFLTLNTLMGYNSRNPLPPEWVKFRRNELIFAIYLPYVNEN